METPQQVISGLIVGNHTGNETLITSAIGIINLEKNPDVKKTYVELLLKILVDVDILKMEQAARFMTDRGLLTDDDIFICLSTRAAFSSEEDQGFIGDVFGLLGYTSDHYEKLGAFIDMKVSAHKDAKLPPQTKDTEDY
jgi:hypothetical protein